MKKALIWCLLLALLPFSLPCPAEDGEERPAFTSRSRVTTDYFSTASMLQIFDDFKDPPTECGNHTIDRTPQLTELCNQGPSQN